MDLDKKNILFRVIGRGGKALKGGRGYQQGLAESLYLSGQPSKTQGEKNEKNP